MSRNPLRRLSIALAVALTAAACGGTTSESSVYSDVPTAIVINSATGDVIVNADAPVSGVLIDSDVSNTDITTDLADGVLTITDDCDGDGCSVNYFVQMRGDVSVEITTESATISVNDINGDAMLSSETGLITLSGVTGTVSASTEDARIIATRMESALAEFRAGSGAIDVTFDEPAEVLVAETGSGDITVQLPDGPYAIETSTGAGAVELAFDSDPASDKMVSLTTGEGDIEVYRK